MHSEHKLSKKMWRTIGKMEKVQYILLKIQCRVLITDGNFTKKQQF